MRREALVAELLDDTEEMDAVDCVEKMDMSVTERLDWTMGSGEGGTESGEIESTERRELIEAVVEEADACLGAEGGTSWSWRFSGWFVFAGGGRTTIKV
jgi:hypothetical protein